MSAALVVVAAMTGHLFTADTLRYLFYVENLFRSANAVDFYPVAWSLAVEEWFYLLFAPLLFLLGRARSGAATAGSTSPSRSCSSSPSWL